MLAGIQLLVFPVLGDYHAVADAEKRTYDKGRERIGQGSDNTLLENIACVVFVKQNRKHRSQKSKGNEARSKLDAIEAKKELEIELVLFDVETFASQADQKTEESGGNCPWQPIVGMMD
jgi:hypothetical protein